MVERDGLHVINDDFNRTKGIVSTIAAQRIVEDGSLWYKSQGHASISTMQKIQFFHNKAVDIAINSTIIFAY